MGVVVLTPIHQKTQRGKKGLESMCTGKCEEKEMQKSGSLWTQRKNEKEIGRKIQEPFTVQVRQL